MKVNMFIPKYMLTFKCIGSECVDTCCAGWDINIDEDTYEKYTNCTGKLKELVQGKIRENRNSYDYLNKGFMILKENNKCPFLNDNLLCTVVASSPEKMLFGEMVRIEKQIDLSNYYAESFTYCFKVKVIDSPLNLSV